MICTKPLEEYGLRLAEREFARLESWTLEQRRAILAKLVSMHPLEFRVSELNRWLAQIPGPASNPSLEKIEGPSAAGYVRALRC
jgi:hypothetical protein